MHRHFHARRKPALLLSVPALALVLTACGSDGHSGAHMGSGTPATASSTYGPAATGPHNTQDVTFATDMIPHHAQAVEMSKLAATRAADSRVKALATAIEQAQGPEISQMSGWLAGWGAEVPQAMGGHDMTMGGGHGMMTGDEMAALEAAQGGEFDKLFLAAMTKHHEGAVEMARTEATDGESSQAIELARKIISAQESEIALMQKIMSDLKG